MKNRNYFLQHIVFKSFFLLALSCNGRRNKHIGDAFNSYKNAMIHDRFDDAANTLDKQTIHYYDTLASCVKYGDSTEISSLPLFSKVMVMLTRATANLDEVKSLDGKKLFVFGCKMSPVKKKELVKSYIKRVQTNGDFAIAEVSNPQLDSFAYTLSDSFRVGTPPKMWFHFYREDGSWKLNLASQLNFINDYLKQEIKSKWDNEDAFVITLVEKQTGSILAPSLWKPVLSKAH